MNLQLTKRQKIVISAVVLTLGLLFTQTINFFLLRYRLVISLSVLALILSLWSLWEGITKLKAAILLILPTLFTLGVASFYFLLPIRWLTRLPVAAVFCFSFYSLLLAENVFNVASERTIPLYRAASTVAFLFTLITAFFIFNTIFALNLPFSANAIAVAVVAFPLAVQSLWSIEMEKVTPVILVYSAVIALILGEIALAFSFWPLVPTMWSLALSTLLYVLLGIMTEFFKDHLKDRIVWEYVGVGGLILLFTIILTSWTS